MAHTKRHISPKQQKQILVASATVLAVLAALFIFLYRDVIFGSHSDKYDAASGIKDSEPFTYENGSNQSFALKGDCLAIASSTGLQLLDKDGKTVSRQVFSMDEPCVASGGGTCVFYDVGGTALRAYFGDEYKEMDTAGDIISASVNSSGYLAVAANETGYKGCVTVYDSSGQEIYKWYSGTGYTLDAAVMPSCDRLAVLCVEEVGSVLHFFKLNEEQEYATASLPSELAYDMGASDSDGVFVLSSDAIHFFDKNANEDNTFTFGDYYLVDYDFSEGYCAAVLSKYISGSQVTIKTFSPSGKELGSADLPFSPTCLSSQKSKLLVFGASGLRLYSRDMDLIKESTSVSGYKSCLLMSDGSVLLLASYHGEKITLR